MSARVLAIRVSTLSAVSLDGSQHRIYGIENETREQIKRHGKTHSHWKLGTLAAAAALVAMAPDRLGMAKLETSEA